MSDPFLGEIRAVGFNFPPRGWSFCEGQLLAISQNSALFSLLGTTYGGDGRTTFGLPDLRGRSIVSPGTGAGLSQIRQGEKGGVATRTLTAAQMPAHTHTFAPPANSGAADTDTPTSNYPAVAEDANRNGLPVYAAGTDVAMGAGTTGSAGSTQAYNTRNPYLGVYYCIALVGIFPSRS